MSRKINYIVFLILSLTLITVSLISKPQRNGDGHEYSLIAKSFVNHLSPDIALNDISDRINDIKKYDSSGYGVPYFENIKNGILANEENAANTGNFKSNNGSYFGYHFWFYPLLTALTEKILAIFDMNPLKSFQLANALFLVFALYLIAIKDKRDWIAQFLFLAGGVLFYLKWTHPEVMIYTFVFLAFYYLITERPFLSIAFISLASIQVVSISLLFVIIPFYIAIIKKESIIATSFDLLKRWQTWLYGIISISSIVFYYTKFGKFSLIGSQASSISNINFHHFISYYFDLDQGVWIGAPWVVLFIFFLKKKNNHKLINDLVFSLLFSIFICIPLMANNNINSGQSIFQRYALYSIAPIIAWCCVYSSTVLNNINKKIVLLFVAALYILFCREYINEENTMVHKPWTSYLLENYPHFYEPEPDIFIVRTFPINKWLGGMKNSYAYKNSNGVVTKIIYRETENKLFSDSCNGEYKDLKTHKPIDLSTSSFPRYGWRYITGEMYCDGFIPYDGIKYSSSTPNTIDFKKTGFPSFVAGASGVGQVEGWGRWSEGQYVKLFLDVELNKSVTFYIELTTFGPNAGKTLLMTVNNERRVLVPEAGKENRYVAKFEFPEVVKKPEITIKVPSPVSPAQLGLSDDTREIGLGLIKMHWE
ncbi:hypothetical protein HV173_14900 [Citrobacter freundii]|nr:hypothetical protein [Citrobacter freundii]QLU67392.1 hypothetical protein HV173_14900 [Citrobacter freundii]